MEVINSGKESIDEFIQLLNEVDDILFKKVQDIGGVTYNGIKFSGSKDEFKKRVLHEKQSQYELLEQIGINDLIQKLNDLGKNMKYEYDHLVFKVHGKRYENRGKIDKVTLDFNGVEKDRSLLSDINKKVKISNGTFSIASCFKGWDGKNNDSARPEQLELIPPSYRIAVDPRRFLPKRQKDTSEVDSIPCEISFSPFKAVIHVE